jgi:hypothetical protein
MYVDEIMDWVALYLDAAISRTALHMLINDAGLTYKILRRAASERDEEAREQWRELIRTTLVASMIVTADESSKDERTIFRKRGRAPSGHRAEIDADFVRGLRYSILAAITIDGYIGTRIVVGSVDGDECYGPPGRPGSSVPNIPQFLNGAVSFLWNAPYYICVG